MVSFLQNTLLTVAERYGSLGAAIIELTVILRLLLVPVFHPYYKSTLLADALQSRVDEIYRKEKNAQIAAKKVSRLFVSVGYPSLAMLSYLLVFGTLDGLLAAALYHLPAAGLPEQQLGLFGLLENLCISPYQVLNGSGSLSLVMASALAPVLCGVCTHLHDRPFSQHSCVQRKELDMAVLIASVAASVLLPLGCSLYWIVLCLIGSAHMLVTRRFQHVTIHEKIHG